MTDRPDVRRARPRRPRLGDVPAAANDPLELVLGFLLWALLGLLWPVLGPIGALLPRYAVGSRVVWGRRRAERRAAQLSAPRAPA